MPASSACGGPGWADQEKLVYRCFLIDIFTRQGSRFYFARAETLRGESRARTAWTTIIPVKTLVIETALDVDHVKNEIHFLSQKENIATVTVNCKA